MARFDNCSLTGNLTLLQCEIVSARKMLPTAELAMRFEAEMHKRKLAAGLLLIVSVIGLTTMTACGDFFVSNDAVDHVSLSATALVLSSNNGSTGAESKALSATAVTVGGDTSDV